jgi:predicted enzyme related to lactoylglutathione lyase
MKNNLTWFEINVTDLDRAKAFYQTIFGSEFTFYDMVDAPMYMFNADQSKGEIGGALVKASDNGPSDKGTVIYFSSQDVSLEAARVEQAGGKLLFPKTSIGDFGFIAHFIDTEGNRIGLHSLK